jgi:hypothetical protein
MKRAKSAWGVGFVKQHSPSISIPSRFWPIGSSSRWSSILLLGCLLEGAALVQFFRDSGRALLSFKYQDSTLGEMFYPDAGTAFDAPSTCINLIADLPFRIACSVHIAMPTTLSRDADLRAITNAIFPHVAV